MSTNHTKPWSTGEPLKRGPMGFFLCRQCGKECVAKRRTICSTPCREQWLIERSPGYVRAKLRDRDKGVCARCNLDTKDLQEALHTFRCLAYGRYGDRFERVLAPLRLLREALGVGAYGTRRTLWDADHIRAVVEGGGECGLENFQTLCIWCHKEKTAALARRRAAARARGHGDEVQQPILEDSAGGRSAGTG